MPEDCLFSKVLEQSHQKFTFVRLQLPKLKVKKARPSTTTSLIEPIGTFYVTHEHARLN